MSKAAELWVKEVRAGRDAPCPYWGIAACEYRGSSGCDCLYIEEYRAKARDLSGGEVERAIRIIENGNVDIATGIGTFSADERDTILRALSAMSRDDAGVVTRLAALLTGIEEIIFATGAPLGTSEYFKIRELAASRREILSSVGYKENPDG